MAIQHGGNPAKYGPAGGLDNFQEDIEVVGLDGPRSSAPSSAPPPARRTSSPASSATWRPPAARAWRCSRHAWPAPGPSCCRSSPSPAGLAAVGLHRARRLAGRPGRRRDRRRHAAVLVAGALSAAVAVGVSALVGSRGPVIGIMLAFYLAVQNLLLAMGFLGGVRQIVPDVGDPAGSATSSRPRTCTSGWAPRSSS